MAQQYINTIDLAYTIKFRGGFSIFQVYNHIMRGNALVLKNGRKNMKTLFYVKISLSICAANNFL